MCKHLIHASPPATGVYMRSAMESILRGSVVGRGPGWKRTRSMVRELNTTRFYRAACHFGTHTFTTFCEISPSGTSSVNNLCRSALGTRLRGVATRKSRAVRCRSNIGQPRQTAASPRNASVHFTASTRALLNPGYLQDIGSPREMDQPDSNEPNQTQRIH